jgi:hypothetical protein
MRRVFRCRARQLWLSFAAAAPPTCSLDALRPHSPSLARSARRVKFGASFPSQTFRARVGAIPARARPHADPPPLPPKFSAIDTPTDTPAFQQRQTPAGLCRWPPTRPPDSRGRAVRCAHAPAVEACASPPQKITPSAPRRKCASIAR